MQIRVDTVLFILGMLLIITAGALVMAIVGCSEVEMPPDDFMESDTEVVDSFSGATDGTPPFDGIEGESIVPEEAPKPRKSYSKEYLMKVGRLAKGIRRWHRVRNHGMWWECGMLYSDVGQHNRALEWAKAIVDDVEEVNRSARYKFSFWGVAATIANESGFDSCALGLNPRKRAYQLGILKKQKQGISHTREDVIRVVTHPKMIRWFSATGVDIGAMQLLSRLWPENYSIPDMLVMENAVDVGVAEMARRARVHASTQPWAYWRGRYTEWYRLKIIGRARILGATKFEVLKP